MAKRNMESVDVFHFLKLSKKSFTYQVFEILREFAVILAGYDLNNILNMDKTGFYFRALPDRTLLLEILHTIR